MSDIKTSVGTRMAYDGGRNITYDLSGIDERFAHQLDVMVFEPNQIVNFEIPVFLNEKMIIYKLVEGDDGSTTKQVISQTESETDKGWMSLGDDSDAMSKAYLLWGGSVDTTADPSKDKFDGHLIKRIKVNLIDSPSDDPIKIEIHLQQFYMDLYEYNKFDGVGPTYTPALGKYLLDKLDGIESILAHGIESTFSASDTANDMKEEDLTGLNEMNYIEFETHQVRTSSGLDTLMPARGSFYANRFTMWRYTPRTGTVQEANRPYNLGTLFIYTDVNQVGTTKSVINVMRRVILTEENYDSLIGMAGTFIDINKPDKLVKLTRGIDYEFTNLNVAKTEKSESQYGVYDTIQLLKSFNCSILMSYQCFGGNVVYKDVQDMRKDLIDVIKVLSSKNLITSDCLIRQPVIIDIMNRLLDIEQYHSHFNRVEHSVFTGKPGFHWITIAELYDVAWGQTLSAVDEIGTFRVESKARGWCYEFALAVDLRQKLVNMLRCKTLATNDVGIADLKDYIAYLNSKDDVAIRVCWIDDGLTHGEKSGIVLQLGWNYKNYPTPTTDFDTDTIIVSDKSGMTSKWKLVYNPLDNSFVSEASMKIFNHKSYKVIYPGTIPEPDVQYYKMTDVWTYYKTASTYIKDLTDYFKIVVEAGVSKYEKIEGLVVGRPVKDYADEYPDGIFERSFYSHIPQMFIPTEGEVVGPGVYIIDEAATYEGDASFQMPNESMRWISGDSSSKKISRVLEPSEGYLTWFGNVNLAKTVNQKLTLTSAIEAEVQSRIDIFTIKGLTVRLYDRKENKIVSRRADVMYDPIKDDIYGQVIIDLLDLCGASVRVYKSNNNVMLDIVPFVGTDSYINERFDLRQIDLHF